ncbi:TniQ family protein [Cytobacillus solani]|uniref:TniQ family protein n=1 Tax=Cytobacillus solani TaxID=1637975 RepID=UPI00114F92E4|nr:TniQ family protein [Cytobacillus solani]
MVIDINRLRDTESGIDNYFSSRSILYSVEPIGVGTPYVEGLASYISRLAINHNVSMSVLITEVITQNINIVYLKNEQNKGSILSDTNRFINENSLITLEFTNTIAKLTNRRDIHYLTMINWKGIFNNNIRETSRKWCPSCLNQMLFKSEVVYEPLLWCLSDIKKCDIHENRLENKCPSCKRELPFIHSRLEVGRCQYCRAWLGDTGDSSVKDPLSDKEKFINLNYMQLIETGPSLEYYPTKGSFGYRLNQIKTSLGFKSTAEFAEYLGFPQTTVWGWINNKYVPTHENLLKTARKLNTTIYDIFYNKEIKIKLDMNIYGNRERKRSIPLGEIEYFLKNNINSKEPKSLMRIAKEEGFSADTAKANLPLLCEILRNHFETYKKQQQLKIQKEIETKLNQCLREEIPISLKQFSIKYEVTLRSARKYAPDLCKKVVFRYKEHTSKLKDERVKNITNEIRHIVFDLHQKGIKPSIWNVQKEMKSTCVFLEDEVKGAFKEIVSSLGYKF